ncbi:MAG: class I SAM-dependent methyltransferase [Pirellulaceae bacterium]|nr:class I SAM-dependent methyltransferase [Pirellulaceae bacterium]
MNVTAALDNKSNKFNIRDLTEAQSTLLMPLWARALENRHPQPLLQDRKAVEIVDSLDFDFESFAAKGVPQADFCIRASVIDQLVTEFLCKHPSGTVVEFGVGLDTRFDRLDNGQVTWIELDLPHVIDLREKFFESNGRRQMLRGSIAESEWIERVLALVKGPVLFVAEGVLYFISSLQVHSLIDNLVSNFPNAAFIFDAQSPWFLWFSNLKQPVPNAQMKFSVGNVRELCGHDAKQRVHRWIGYGDSPYYDGKMQRLSPVKFWGRRLCPPVRSMFKIIDLRW